MYPKNNYKGGQNDNLHIYTPGHSIPPPLALLANAALYDRQSIISIFLGSEPSSESIVEESTVSKINTVLNVSQISLIKFFSVTSVFTSNKKLTITCSNVHTKLVVLVFEPHHGSLLHL